MTIADDLFQLKIAEILMTNSHAASDRVEAEIARLKQESEENFTAFMDERDKAVVAEAEVSRLRDGLRERDRLLRWALNYIGIDWDESYPDEPPAVTEARALLVEDGAAREFKGVSRCGCKGKCEGRGGLPADEYCALREGGAA